MKPVRLSAILRIFATRHSKLVLTALFLALVGLKAALSASLKTPVSWGDSFLYLSRARNLVAKGWPILENVCGPDYPPLYSFLIAPAYWLGDDPDSVYRVVLLINSLLSSCIVFPAYLLSRSLTGKILPSLVLTALASVMTASFGFSLVIMAENVMLPLTTLLVLLILRYRELHFRSAASLGLVAALTVLTKSVALAFLPAVILLGVMTVFGEKRSRGRAISQLLVLLAALVLPVAAWKVWNVWTQVSFPMPLSGTYGVHRYLNAMVGIFQEGAIFLRFCRILLNLFSYLSLGTFLLAPLAVFGAVERLLKAEERRGQWIAFLGLVFGILTLSALHSLVFFERNPERYSLYGRYVDCLVPSLTILGFVFLASGAARRRGHVICASICAFLAATTIPEPTFWLHRSSLFYLEPFFRLLASRPVIIVAALLPLVLFLLFRSTLVRTVAPLLLLSVSLLGSAYQFTAVRGASRHARDRHPILASIRQTFSRQSDRLVVSSREFLQASCYAPFHWMIMYLTEAPPIVVSAAPKPRSFEVGLQEVRKLGQKGRVFYLTSSTMRDAEPLAQEEGLTLYRTTAEDLLQHLQGY